LTRVFLLEDLADEALLTQIFVQIEDIL